jgi:hypothetical protein
MSKAKQLLLDYRTTPNCGEYGVTRGWMERVDEAIKEIDAREIQLRLLEQKLSDKAIDEAIVRDRKARDED